MFVLELKEKIRLQTGGCDHGIGCDESKPKRTPSGTEALLHSNVGTLRRTRMEVLPHPAAKPILIGRPADVGDVRSFTVPLLTRT